MRYELLTSTCFEQISFFSQLFIIRSDGHMISNAENFVDSKLFTGVKYIVPNIILKIDAHMTLSTVVHISGEMRILDASLFQQEDIFICGQH